MRRYSLNVKREGLYFGSRITINGSRLPAINVSRLTINAFQLVRRTRTRASWIAAGAAWSRSTRCRPTCRGPDSERRELLLQCGGFAGGTGRHRRALHDHLKAMVAFLTDIFKDRHGFYSLLEVTNGIISRRIPSGNVDGAIVAVPVTIIYRGLHDSGREEV